MDSEPEIPDFDDRPWNGPYDDDDKYGGGAPNQHCGECRRLGICAYHRDWPHNIGGREG